MDDLRERLLDLCDRAVEKAAEARYELTEQLTHDEDYLPDFTDAMNSVAYQQTYARWWRRVTDPIEADTLDPEAALANVRADAGNRLLRYAAVASRTPCPEASDLPPAVRDATRSFHDATAPANIEALGRIRPATGAGTTGTDTAMTTKPTTPEPVPDPLLTVISHTEPTLATQALARHYDDLTEALVHLNNPTQDEHGDAATSAATTAAPTTQAITAARDLAVAIRPLIIHLPVVTAALADAAAYRADDGGWCTDCIQAPGELQCVDHAQDQVVATAYEIALHAITG